MPYTYKFPHPAVTADVAVFRFAEGTLQLLLVQRRSAPFAGRWALPGGFVEIDEDLADGARRELREETGLRIRSLSQIGAFGAPHRDPRERVISVAFSAVVATDVTPHAADDAQALRWAGVAALPPLAFDHAKIIAVARARLRHDFTHSSLARSLLPHTFTADELARCASAVLGRTLSPRPTAARLRRTGVLRPAGDGRYRFDAAGFRRRPRAFALLAPDA